jgi:hypothetical protein
MFKRLLSTLFGAKSPETASPGTIDIKLLDLYTVLQPLIPPQDQTSIHSQVCEGLMTMTKWVDMSSPDVPIQSIVGLNHAVTNLREILKIKDQNIYEITTGILQSMFDHRDTLTQAGGVFVHLHETPDTKPTLSLVDRASVTAEVFSMSAFPSIQPTPAHGETFNSMGQKLLAVDNNLTHFFLNYGIKENSPKAPEISPYPLPKPSDPGWM